MKKKFLFLLFLTLCLTVLIGCNQSAYKLDWHYQDGTLTVLSSSNGILFHQDEWDEISNQIHTVIVKDGILEIGAEAFLDMKNLTKAVLHDGITEIGDYAFQGTSVQLESLPDSLTRIGTQAFAGSGFELGELPASLRSIGGYAFAECKVPATMVLSENLTSLKYAFTESVGLKEVYLPESMMELNTGTFSGCHELTIVHFPSKIQELPHHYFQNCTALKSISLPMYVRDIGSEAFAGCTALEEIEFPAKLHRISREAFRNCTALTELTLPEGLMTIDEMAFQGCSGLTAIHFPDQLTSIYEHAFQDCTGLETVHLPPKLAALQKNAFEGCINLSAFVIPENSSYFSTDELGFLYDATGKELVLLPPKTDPTIYISDGIEVIGGEAFSTSSVQEVILPDSVIRLEHGAFWGSDVSIVYLPDSIEYIGYNLFAGCENLSKVYYSGSESQWNGIENIEHTNKHFSEFLIFDTPAP